MTQAHEPGTWTTVSVTAADHDSAKRKAVRDGRKRGGRVRAVGGATRLSAGSTGKGHRWSVDIRVERHTASNRTPVADPEGPNATGPVPHEVAPPPGQAGASNASPAERRGDSSSDPDEET